MLCHLSRSAFRSLSPFDAFLANRTAGCSAQQQQQRSGQRARSFAPPGCGRPISTSGSTVDASEIERFSKAAHLWWRESGEYAPLHALNALRVPLIRDALANRKPADSALPLRGSRILDVGCGGGILSEPLARLGADVTGIDASAESIRVAELHWSSNRGSSSSSGSSNIDGSSSDAVGASRAGSSSERTESRGSLSYRCITAEELLLSTEQPLFDAVVASEIVEHVSDAGQFVDVCCQLVKPKGSIFFTTLNRTSVAYVLGIVTAEYILRTVPPGTHEWDKFISPEELEAMVRKNNFRTVLTHGMCYNVLTNKWRWSQSHSINYCLHAVHEPPSSSEEEGAGLPAS